jgi:hypothetical protein
VITVFLKIMDRGNTPKVLECLNFWIGIFENKEKYDLIIYNENLKLPPEYSSYKVITRSYLLDDPGCKKLFEQINKSSVHQRWRGAALALAAPYFYRHSTDLIANIDADDIVLYSPNAKSYIQKVEEAFDDPKIFTLSYDMHFSTHTGDFYSFRPHHWTFGCNFSRKKEMHDIILKGLFNPPPEPPWNLNLDYIVDKALDNISTPYVAWITPDYLVHKIHPDFNMNKFSKFDKTRGLVESKLYGKIEYKEKHPKVLLIE